MSFVMNPETGRMIKVGGRVYSKLMKDRIINSAGDYARDENILYDIIPHKEEALSDSELEDLIESKKEELDEELPDSEQAVKGRGKYQDKIVKRKKALTINDNLDLLANLFSDIVEENKENLMDLSRTELMESFQELIKSILK